MRTLTRHFCGAMLCRAFWAGASILHVGPWVGATRSLLEQPSVAGFVAWLGVALAIIFFVLKTLDVCWLRFGSRRQFALVFVVACALVHHEAAVDGVDEVAAVAVAVAVAVSGAKVLSALRSSLADTPTMAWSRYSLCLRRAVVLKTPDPIAVRRASRAPPLTA